MQQNDVPVLPLLPKFHCTNGLANSRRDRDRHDSRGRSDIHWSRSRSNIDRSWCNPIPLLWRIRRCRSHIHWRRSRGHVNRSRGNIDRSRSRSNNLHFHRRVATWRRAVVVVVT